MSGVPQTVVNFEVNERVEEAVSAMRAGCEKYARGDQISWAVLAKMTGLEYGSYEFTAATRKYRDEVFRERGIFIDAVRGWGLRWLLNSEQVEHGAVGRRKRARGQLRRGVNELVRVDAEALTDHDRTRAARHHAAMRDEQKAISTSLRDLRKEE